MISQRKPLKIKASFSFSFAITKICVCDTFSRGWNKNGRHIYFQLSASYTSVKHLLIAEHFSAISFFHLLSVLTKGAHIKVLKTELKQSTLFYKQLGSGFSPQSCLYFQGFLGSKEPLLLEPLGFLASKNQSFTTLWSGSDWIFHLSTFIPQCLALFGLLFFPIYSKVLVLNFPVNNFIVGVVFDKYYFFRLIAEVLERSIYNFTQIYKSYNASTFLNLNLTRTI